MSIAGLCVGMPVQIAGLKGVPHAGDSLRVMASEERAKDLSEARTTRYKTHHHKRIEELAKDHYDVSEHPETGAPVHTLKPSVSLVIIADVDGSLEALTDALLALNTSSVVFKVASASVGKPSLNDVRSAEAAGAILVAFGVNAASSIKKECEKCGVELLQHKYGSSLLFRSNMPNSRVGRSVAPQCVVRS